MGGEIYLFGYAHNVLMKRWLVRSWCVCTAAAVAMFLFRRGTRVAPARSGRWSVRVASYTERAAGSVECRDAATHGELIQHT